MAVVRVPNLTLLPQDKTNACWYCSAQRVHPWASANDKKTVKDPTTVKTDRFDLKGLYDTKPGYATSTCIELASAPGLTALAKKKRGYDEFKALLAQGPIWAAGAKGGADGSYHVMVIGGVADAGLMLFDPLPLNRGQKTRKTWEWMDDFFDITNRRIDANLLVIPQAPRGRFRPAALARPSKARAARA